MKVISLSNKKIDILAKELEILMQTNNLTTSNLIFNQEDKTFNLLVFYQDTNKLPTGQLGEKMSSPSHSSLNAPLKFKKETLEKWKKEYPSIKQIKVLIQMGYKDKEANGMSKFQAHKIIGEKYGSGKKS